jgi:hypothetical protein
MAQATVPPELLAQLAPNDPPGTVSMWPLAIGYWLVLALLVALIAAGAIYWLRGKKRRSNLKQLKLIKKSSAQTHCRDVHLLLRSILQQHNTKLACCSEYEFSNYVMTSLNVEEPPRWLNAHYREQTPPAIPWADIHQLVTQWTKEPPR